MGTGDGNPGQDKDIQQGCQLGCLLLGLAFVGFCVYSGSKPPSEATRARQAADDAAYQRAAERAVEGSVLEEGTVRVQAFLGTMHWTIDAAHTIAWENQTCDVQRRNMDVLWSKWSYQIGRVGGRATSIQLLSYTGREIGSRSAFGGYHCE